MYDQRLVNTQRLPISLTQRKRTDVICTFIGAALAITLFVFSIIYFIQCNKVKTKIIINILLRSIPSVQAALDLSFSTRTKKDIKSPECVASCPNNYISRAGACFPASSSLRSQYISSDPASTIWENASFAKVLFFSAIISLSLALVWMAITFLCARIAPFLLSLLLLLSAIYLILAKIFPTIAPSPFSDILNSFTQTAQIIFLAALGVIFLGVFFWTLCYWRQLSWQGVMLQYAALFVNTQPNILIYSLLFVLAAILFIALVLFQYFSFEFKYRQGSSSKAWSLAPNLGILQILNLVELIWGLQFLKDAYHYTLSRLASDWYWTRGVQCCIPCGPLSSHNWGSVVGGSLLHILFFFPNLLLNFFTCHTDGCCPGTACRSGFFAPITFARSDAYSFIYLTGVPFCNAARQVQKISSQSQLFVGSVSPLSVFRFLSHVLISIIVLFLAIILIDSADYQYSWWHFLVIWILGELLSSWFLDLQPDLAESLQTNLLVDYHLKGDLDATNLWHSAIRKQVRALLTYGQEHPHK